VTDAHAHLDGCEESPSALVDRAREAGVTRIVTIGTGVASCHRVIEIADEHEGVFATVGIDPHQAATPEADRVEELRPLLAHPKVVAVGEAGLDGHYGRDTMREQEALFAAQLDLAAEAGLPIVIHCREAVEETLRFLRAFPRTVVLHCFSEPGLLSDALEHGWYLSFAGNVTYPSAVALREAAAAAPADRLLVETDSPFLAPTPHRGRPNEPAYAMHTLAALADVRGVDADELEAQVDRNANAAFALPAA
jgi:TatD DNase family protein